MKHPAEPMISPLSHDEARYALQAAADGQLTAADQQALDQHLAAAIGRETRFPSPGWEGWKRA